ncbi:MAG TPA: Mu transposase C-terminal domain-containing protein [Acidothermaceae bacterium]|jgi:hypothetical protein|nr:Mu transposase C-terminal domain-containing protein [Acidothermaceae bacterium]
MSAASNVREIAPGTTAAPRKAYVAHKPHVIRQSVAALTKLEAQNGRLTKADYNAEAVRLDVSRRTVETWFARAQVAEPAEAPLAHEPIPRSRRTTISLTTDDYQYFAGVSVSSAYYAMLADGRITPVHYSTLRRAYEAQVPLDIRSGLRRGEKVMPKDWSYPPGTQTALGKVYTLDLFFPGIRCADRNGQLLENVVWIAVRDAAVRLPLAWHLFDHAPTSPEVTALVGQAIRGYFHDGVYCGGVPERVRCDNEGLLNAMPHREELMHLRIQIDPTNSYSSWENGGHERMHRAIREELLTALPGHTNGPKTKAKKLYVVPGVAPIPFEELAAMMDRWARSYAFEREIDGATPFEQWRDRIEAGETVEKADTEGLAHLALEYGQVLLGKKGVRVDGEDYWNEELHGQPLRTLTARRWLSDRSTAEVFRLDGTFVGSIPLRNAATGANVAASLKHRGGSLATVAASIREAERRRALLVGTYAVEPTDDSADPLDPEPSPTDAVEQPSLTTSPAASTSASRAARLAAASARITAAAEKNQP